MMKFIKPVMAVMLLACLLHLPYGYYSLVRFVAMVVFAVLAYQYYKEKNDTLMITFGAFVLLFQPFIKIALGRGLWNLIDVVAAAILIALWAKEQRK
uniref:DUF6804 family protein n=1 Tax=Prevotella sp. TaxID=59823 RepID=UPI004025F3A3